MSSDQQPQQPHDAVDLDFVRAGKLLADRSCQTTELDAIELNEVDAIAAEIRRDVEVSHRLLLSNSSVKFAEIQQILYQVMNDRLNDTQKMFRDRLDEVRRLYRMKLKRARVKVDEEYEVRNERYLTRLALKHNESLEDKREAHSRALKNFRVKDDEYQQLRFSAARYYMLLRKHNVLDSEQNNTAEDTDRIHIADLMEKYHSGILKCDEQIRILRANIFQLEEAIEKAVSSRGDLAPPPRNITTRGGGRTSNAGMSSTSTLAFGGLDIGRVGGGGPQSRVSSAARGRPSVSSRQGGPRQSMSDRNSQFPLPSSVEFDDIGSGGLIPPSISAQAGSNLSRRSTAAVVSSSSGVDISIGNITVINETYVPSNRRSRVVTPDNDRQQNMQTSQMQQFRQQQQQHSDDFAKMKSREALIQTLEEESEARLSEALLPFERELESLRQMKEKVTKEWEARLRSAESMYSDSHLKKIMRRQSRLLKLANAVAMDRLRKVPKIDKVVECLIAGLTLADVQKFEKMELERLEIERRETEKLRELEELESVNQKEQTDAELNANDRTDDSFEPLPKRADSREARSGSNIDVLGTLLALDNNDNANEIITSAHTYTPSEHIASVNENSKAFTHVKNSANDQSSKVAHDIDTEGARLAGRSPKIVKPRPASELSKSNRSKHIIRGLAGVPAAVVKKATALAPLEIEGLAVKNGCPTEEVPLIDIKLLYTEKKSSNETPQECNPLLPSIDRFCIRPWSSDSTSKGRLKRVLSSSKDKRVSSGKDKKAKEK